MKRLGWWVYERLDRLIFGPEPPCGVCGVKPSREQHLVAVHEAWWVLREEDDDDEGDIVPFEDDPGTSAA